VRAGAEENIKKQIWNLSQLSSLSKKTKQNKKKTKLVL
jgi:hypothetical protein